MQGVLYTIDQLGNALAQANEVIAQRDKQIQELQKQLDSKEG